MSIGIQNYYDNNYYKQNNDTVMKNRNTSNDDINKDSVEDKINGKDTKSSNNVDVVNDISTSDNLNTNKKTSSVQDYFNEICEKNPNLNLYMGDSFVKKKGEVTFAFSPQYLNKAANDPKKAEEVDKIMDSIQSSIQSFSNMKYSPLDGREIVSTSFTVDADGNFSCYREFKETDAVKQKRKDDEKAAQKKKLELKEKAKKEKAKAENKLMAAKAKIKKEQAVCNYYRNAVKNSLR